MPVEGEVQIWRLPLALQPGLLDVLRGYLTPDELARAGRYVHVRDRDEFIAARGQLRTVLSRYIGCHPREVRFVYGARGKPYLSGPAGTGSLDFNLSHTRGLGLCVVAWRRKLGVDVELIRPELDIDGIARSTFSRSEQAELAALPLAERVAAFFACWTRKEAYIKARGDGLGYPLHAFDVSLRPGAAPALLRSREGPAEQRRWNLHAVDAGEGYAAALAVERPISRLRECGTVSALLDRSGGQAQH